MGLEEKDRLMNDLIWLIEEWEVGGGNWILRKDIEIFWLGVLCWKCEVMVRL